MEYIKKYIADMGSIKQEIRILKYPNGKYYNHYGWNEKRGAGDSIAGEFETLEEAKRMLLDHPEMPACQVGRALGITDKSNFRHQFKSVTGLTPTEWRKKFKK